ncbi:MAG: molybdopterin-dependent oxidoreductase [Myxococcota bacterium]|nr:molybdopterin-dependent oxidoreductase [Myxococcota bacterium]
MPELPTYCRACEGFCGLQATVEGGRITALAGDPHNPKSAGHSCSLAMASAAEPHASGRPTRPRKRVGDQWEEVDWQTAIQEIGLALRKHRNHHPRAVGLYAGPELATDHRGALRAAAFALGAGTPNLFSPLAMYGASRLRAVEAVVGAPVPLTADVGRSHYTILIGADQDNSRWGPLQSGTIHTQAHQYFRARRKGTKLIVVDPQVTPTSASADEHIRIRPGTEAWFLLGLAHATLNNNWIDEQYVRDYTVGIETLREWLAPWTPKVCAEICGIDVGEIAGVGLKYGRSAMSTIVPGASLLQSEMGTVGMWALLVCSALTANLLRPGGHYETGGEIDLHPVIASFPTERSPKSRVRHQDSLLLQLPGTLLAEEILEPGEGQLKALIVAGGCPLSELPGRPRLRHALESLELLVVADSVDSDTAKLADWVLPTPHFWERGDLHLLDNAALPSATVQATAPLLEAPAQTRPTHQILAELFGEMRPPLRGHWGRHLRVSGRLVATTDLDAWVHRILDWAGLPSEDTLRQMPHGLDNGETDRSNWRPTTEDERLHLAPEALADAVKGLQHPQPTPEHPLRLRTTRRPPGGWSWRHRDPEASEPGVGLHPDLGFEEGQLVRILTTAGSVVGPVRLDESLHPMTVDLPWGWAVPAGDVIGDDLLDPLSGAAECSGRPCRVEPLAG